MANKLTTPPKKEFQSFHDFPIVTDLNNLEADIAFLGIPFGDPYSMGEASNDQSNAPTHIRRYCERSLRGLDRYDFDIHYPENHLATIIFYWHLARNNRQNDHADYRVN